ncbi:MAG TPA: GNAT family N-acetyltransferase [Rhodanobacteraceae bacterium]|nr:GNAT family N-acetyltransferase [Rhodanobacteraceae bacterium]
MTTDDFSIRPIAAADDAAVADIIRTVMTGFGACGPGFAINDPEVCAMTAAYARDRAAYWVVEADGVVRGGGGVAPLDAGDDAICELRKMYFQPELRGRGAGRALIERCLGTARGFGYRACYLETLTGMDAAQRLYLASGFRRIAQPLGRTGHFGCDRFFVREL